MVKNRIKVYARLKKEARPDRLLPHDVVPRKDGGDVLTFYPASRGGRNGHAAGAQKFRCIRAFTAKPANVCLTFIAAIFFLLLCNHHKRDEWAGILNVDDYYSLMDGMNLQIQRCIHQIANPHNLFLYRFDRVFNTCSDQRVIFDAIAEPVIKGVMEGYNGTIFAYGPTGSGKTYSLTGSQTKYRNRGLIPRAIEFVFEFIGRSTDKYVIHISYLEIYNEVAYDLLSPKVKFSTLEELPRVLVMEDEKGEAHFKNLSVLRVSEVKDAMQLLFLGDTNRTIAETPLNEYSSRSHCVFTLHVTASVNETGNSRRSKLNLVDLAGSERLNKLNLNGIMLSEAKYINLSLHYLEQVILALSDARRAHIPFRNSVMTFMLRDSIAGNCLTAMLATLSVAKRNYEETITTCKFAQRVSMVKTDAVINADSDGRQEIEFLRKEVLELRKELAGKDLIKSEELSVKEKDACKKLVKKYLKDGEELAFDDMRKAKLYVVLLKHEVMKRSKLPGQNVSEMERKYKEIICQKDEEINILTNIIETKIPSKISPQQQKRPEKELNINYDKQAFEAFLIKFGHNTQINFYTKTLAEKHAIATNTSQNIVQAQTRIIHIRKIIDIGQKDAETTDRLKFQLRTEQNNYKELLMRLENVKHNIDYLHEGMMQVKNKILGDFAEWQKCGGKILINNIIEKENVHPLGYKFNIHEELDELFSKPENKAPNNVRNLRLFDVQRTGNPYLDEQRIRTFDVHKSKTFEVHKTGSINGPGSDVYKLRAIDDQKNIFLDLQRNESLDVRRTVSYDNLKNKSPDIQHTGFIEGHKTRSDDAHRSGLLNVHTNKYLDGRRNVSFDIQRNESFDVQRIGRFDVQKNNSFDIPKTGSIDGQENELLDAQEARTISGQINQSNDVQSNGIPELQKTGSIDVQTGESYKSDNVYPSQIYIKNNLLQSDNPEFKFMQTTEELNLPLLDLRNSLDLNFDIQVAKLLNPSKIKPTVEDIRTAERPSAYQNDTISNLFYNSDNYKINNDGRVQDNRRKEASLQYNKGEPQDEYSNEDVIENKERRKQDNTRNVELMYCNERGIQDNPRYEDTMTRNGTILQHNEGMMQSSPYNGSSQVQLLHYNHRYLEDSNGGTQKMNNSLKETQLFRDHQHPDYNEASSKMFDYYTKMHVNNGMMNEGSIHYNEDRRFSDGGNNHQRAYNEASYDIFDNRMKLDQDHVDMVTNFKNQNSFSENYNEPIRRIDRNTPYDGTHIANNIYYKEAEATQFNPSYVTSRRNESSLQLAPIVSRREDYSLSARNSNIAIREPISRINTTPSSSVINNSPISGEILESPINTDNNHQATSAFDSLFKPDDTNDFITFMKSIPLTGERDIDEDIVKFYRLKFQS